MARTMTIQFEIHDQGGQLLGSTGEKSLRYREGSGELPQALEQALSSVSPGENVEVPLTAAQAFGEYDPNLRLRLDHSVFETKPEKGMAVQLKSGDGQVLQATVKEVWEDGVGVDANHPLAGRDLVFSVRMIDIDQGQQGGFNFA